MRESKFDRREALGVICALFAGGCGGEVTEQGSSVQVNGSVSVESVNDAWERIRKWLEASAPKIVGNLNPAAGDTEIESAEKALDCRMPDTWRELYRGHNGMNSESNFGSLFCGMQFLSLDEAVSDYTTNNADVEGDFPVRAADAGVRMDDMYNPKWIAFAHDRGETMLRIDMDPGEGGKAGQIIFTDHADDTVIVLAGSLIGFLAAFIQDLEAGRYFLNQEALADGNEFLDCSPEIDVVNWALSPRWKHLAQ